MLAAQDDGIDEVVLLSYPLHPPGRPEELRTSHWPLIDARVIVLSGQADPFASLPLLEASIELIQRVELVTYPGLGHSLLPVIDDVVNRVADFLRNGA